VSGWTVERHLDGVDALHTLGIPDAPTRTVRWCVPERSAIVLGSAQPETDVVPVDGVDIVRRRSGGGAVLVEPGDIVWCDVVIAASDPLWQVDVGRAFYWLGHVWAETLHDLGVADAHVHEGALVGNDWSRKVCFAGLGPGEVTVEGRKIVGISQRRTRAGAMFQCAVLLHWRAERYQHLLQLPDGVADQIGCTVQAIEALPRDVELAFEARLAGVADTV
jgi:lipoate---protein ligase